MIISIPDTRPDVKFSANSTLDKSHVLLLHSLRNESDDTRDACTCMLYCRSKEMI